MLKNAVVKNAMAKWLDYGGSQISTCIWIF